MASSKPHVSEPTIPNRTPRGLRGLVSEHRRALAMVALAVWAIAASAALAWDAAGPGNAPQARLWTSQSIVLVALHNGLSGGGLSTDHLLATGYVGFADDAVSVLRGNALLLLSLEGTPEAAAADALNFTSTNAQCIALGYANMEQVLLTDPSLINDTGFRQYVVNMGNGLGALAQLLSVRPDGTDPLGQIGPANANIIRQDVALLSSLYTLPEAC